MANLESGQALEFTQRKLILFAPGLVTLVPLPVCTWCSPITFIVMFSDDCDDGDVNGVDLDDSGLVLFSGVCFSMSYVVWLAVIVNG